MKHPTSSLLPVCLITVLLLLVPGIATPAKPSAPTLSEKDQQRVLDGKLVLVKLGSDEDPVRTIAGLVEIEATRETIWATLMNLEGIKESSSAVDSVVATRDEVVGDTRFIDLSYVLKVGFSEIRYSVNRQLKPAEHYMTWTLDDSRAADIKDTSGSYLTLPGSAPGKILFVYQARIETGKAIPRWLEEILTQKSLKGYINYVKEAAEG